MNKRTIAIVRAVGVIGATAAVMVGISFANLSTPPVALSPNNLVAASASLAIGTACPGADAPALSGTTLAGFTTATPLVPGQSISVPFCLQNTSQVPVTITASIPSVPTNPVAGDITIGINCTNMGPVANNNQVLSSFTATAFNNALAVNAFDSCTATASLSSSYSGSGGATVSPFDIDFVGNQ